MSVFSYFMRVNESALLMEAMMAKLGLSDKLRTLPDHRNVLLSAAKRCLTCDHPDAYAKWLAAAQCASEAPRYCLNRDLFERVRGR